MEFFFRNFLFRLAYSGLLFLTGFIAQAQSYTGFIENKGQWTEDVRFLAHIPGGKMVLSPASFKYFFLDHERLEALHHFHTSRTERRTMTIVSAVMQYS